MAMASITRLQVDEVERRVCDIASVRLGISRDRISTQDRLIDDLGCESLDTVELFMEIEDAFEITLPENPSSPVDKAVFTRQPFRLADLAELVYLHQGTGRPDRSFWSRERPQSPPVLSLPFTQLGGRWERVGEALLATILPFSFISTCWDDLTNGRRPG
jgi:formylglycine-generating enzyme